MAARSDLASGTCSIPKADDDDGDDEHVSLGGWRSSVGMHISSGTKAGIGHARFAGRLEEQWECTFRRAQQLAPGTHISSG